MPKEQSLHNLVMAISNAVLQAQEKVEAAQLNNLMSYFYRKPGQKGYFPLSMRVNLPSLRPEAKPGDTDIYRVPYLSALPYSSLRIKQVDVDFDVTLGGLTQTENQADSATPNSDQGKVLQGSKALPGLFVDLGAVSTRQSAMAHVKLTLEGVELPEGASRLINELIKTNQIYEFPAGGQGDDKPVESGEGA